jgi:hypothetical protein
VLSFRSEVRKALAVKRRAFITLLGAAAWPLPESLAKRPRYARDDAAGQQCEIRFIFLRKIAIA